MNKLIFYIFITLIGTHVYSQKKLNFGIKAGINLSGFHTGNSAFSDNLGLTFGGVSELSLSEVFSIQGEILYSRKGGDYNIKEGDVTFGSVEVALDYLDVPVLVKWHFIKKMSIDFGPQIGLLLSHKGENNPFSDEDNYEVELKNVNSIDLALVSGISYSFGDKVSAQAKYSYGVSEVFENEKYKNSVMSLGIIYSFN